MFNDIIDGSTGPWKRNGNNEWYHIDNMIIRLCKRSLVIYDLYYNVNKTKVVISKVIVGRTEDEAKDKAESYLKKRKII